MDQLATTQAYLTAVQVEEARENILAGKLGPHTAFEAQQILGIMELPDVPDSELLVKGMLEGPGTAIPLVDLRVKLNALDAGTPQSTSALIVELDGSKVGLIVDTSGQA